MNIENKLKKQDFISFAKDNPNAYMKMWVLPKGALCRISDNDGINVLQNGTNSICSSSIVDALAEHGVKGVVVIDSTQNNAPTLPRWVQYYFTEKTYEDVCNNPHEVIVTTLGNVQVEAGLPFVIKTTTPVEVKASDVASVTRKLSANDRTIDLFLIEGEDGVCYQYEPQRSIDGVIVGHTEKGFIVSFGNGHVVQLVSRVNVSTRNAFATLGVSPKDAVGMAVKVQYTSFMGVGRIKPYKAAMISCIYSLSRLVGRVPVDVNNRPDVTEYMFDVSRPAFASVITPTRLAEAKIFEMDDGIVFYEKYGSRYIAALRKGKKPGMPSVIATTEKDGEQLYYFESEYDNDALMYKSFITVVGRVLSATFGFKVKRTGIYYKTNGVDMLGNAPLDLSSNEDSYMFHDLIAEAAYK